MFHFAITLENNLVVQGMLKIVSLDFNELDKLLANVLTRISYLAFQYFFPPPMSYILNVASKTNDKPKHGHFGLTSIVIPFRNLLHIFISLNHCPQFFFFSKFALITFSPSASMARTVSNPELLNGKMYTN